MQITATLVKELRARTGAGMMDCKHALQAADGDIDAAIEAMRKSGVAKAAKKAGRIAAEGNIVIKGADERTVILEVNTETDFAARDNNFKSFTDVVADCILSRGPNDVGALMQMQVAGRTLEETRQQLIARIGENITVRRFDLIAARGTLGRYLHDNRIGVLVDVQQGDADLAKDLAMHIAASSPGYIGESDVPAEVLAKEREIFAAQATESGKPANVVDKMIDGKMRKYLKEITLLGQPFVKDTDATVENLLKDAGATVNYFIRYEVGEGLEKSSDNFVEQVMAQVQGE